MSDVTTVNKQNKGERSSTGFKNVYILNEKTYGLVGVGSLSVTKRWVAYMYGIMYV